MSNHDFILRSGAKLHITTAPFERAVVLVEAVAEAARGKSPDLDTGNAVLLTAKVRQALYPVFELATYENVRIVPSLFDDLKLGEQARGDYFEICSKVIEVNSGPFFLTTSSKSTGHGDNPTKSQE